MASMLRTMARSIARKGQRSASNYRRSRGRQKWQPRNSKRQTFASKVFQADARSRIRRGRFMKGLFAAMGSAGAQEVDLGQILIGGIEEQKAAQQKRFDMAERTTVGNLRDMARRIIAEGEAQVVKESNEAWELYGQPDVQYADLRSKATSVISQESERKRWERRAS